MQFHQVSFLSRNRHWLIFSVMVAASLLANFHQIGLSTTSGEIGAALGIDATKLGLLAAAFSYPYACMQIPAGLLSDTLGSRKSAAGALIIAALGTALFASTTSFSQAMAARLVIGTGIAVIAVPLMKLTAVWFPSSAFGRLTAISFTFGGFGLFLATSPMAIVSAAIGWRNTYYAMSALTFAFALLVWLIVRDKPVELMGKSFHMPKMRLQHIRMTLVHIILKRQLWFIGLWYFFQGGIYFSFIGLWAGQFLTHGLGLSLQESGMILSLPACALMTSPFFVLIAERIGSKRLTLLGLSTATVILSLPLSLGLPKFHPVILAVYFLIFAMTTMGGAAVLFAAAKELFAIKYAGTVAGFINIFPFLGGAALQQAMGVAIDASRAAGSSWFTAYTHSFSLLTIASAISFSLAICIRSPSKFRPSAIQSLAK